MLRSPLLCLCFRGVLLCIEEFRLRCFLLPDALTEPCPSLHAEGHHRLVETVDRRIGVPVKRGIYGFLTGFLLGHFLILCRWDCLGRIYIILAEQAQCRGGCGLLRLWGCVLPVALGLFRPGRLGLCLPLLLCGNPEKVEQAHHGSLYLRLFIRGCGGFRGFPHPDFFSLRLLPCRFLHLLQACVADTARIQPHGQIGVQVAVKQLAQMLRYALYAALVYVNHRGFAVGVCAQFGAGADYLPLMPDEIAVGGHAV